MYKQNYFPSDGNWNDTMLNAMRVQLLVIQNYTHLCFCGPTHPPHHECPISGRILNGRVNCRSRPYLVLDMKGVEGLRGVRMN